MRPARPRFVSALPDPDHRATRARPLLAACALVLAASGAGPAAQAASLSPTEASAAAPAVGLATLPPSLVEALRAQGLNDASVSVLVLPLGDGAATPRVAHRTSQLRPVASVMKLFTTGAALLSRGPASTWHTDAALDGPLDDQGVLHGHLVLRGGGDPSLVIEQVIAMMQRWQAAGLRRIDGDLVLDRSALALPAHDPAAFDGEALKPYNAGADALLVSQQAVTLRLSPEDGGTGRWRASLEPALAGVSLQASVRGTGPREAAGPDTCPADWRDTLKLAMAPTGAAARQGLRPWRLSVSGDLPWRCGPRDWPLLWQGDGAGDHAARVLLQAWQALGGELGGRVREGSWPAGGKVWQSWTSPPLSQAVRDTNKFSNNVMARQLMLSLVDESRPGQAGVTLPQARLALQTLVQQRTLDAEGQSPCGPDQLMVDNGSGLSRDERTTAACLGRWLQRMWASPVMPEWLGSLPLVGVDGTARRWTGPAVGRAHIKTGSLDGVATMAGVVDGASGQRWAVVALGQHPQGAALRTWYAQLLGWVAGL